MATGSASAQPADTLRAIGQGLWNNAKQRNWEKVINIYKEKPEAHNVQITKSGDTALHIAISDGHEYAVKMLVHTIIKNSNEAALKIQNKLGNTPLHLAAYQGSVGMCHYIAARHPQLIQIDNNAGQTPIILAVKHGRKKAFHCMHQLLCNSCTNEDERYKFCTKKDGTSILYYAISGEYFDLAFQIINLYPKFVNQHTKRGFSPLHLLARAPCVFRSGCHMGILEKFIYFFIYVKRLKPVENPLQGRRNEDNAENSQTPFHLTLQRLRNITWAQELGNRVPKTDAEDPPNCSQQLNHKQGQGPELVSKTSVTFMTRISEGIEAILGIAKIRENKKKHIWSVQVMNKLLENSSSDEYGVNSYTWSSKKEKDTETTHDDRTMGLHEDHKPTQIGPVTTGKEDIEAMENEKKTSLTKMGEIDIVEKIIENSGMETKDAKKEDKAVEGNVKNESPLLIAAKHGIMEMVEAILKKIPVAIHDVNTDDKNIGLLAVENRQPHIYQFILNLKMYKETILYKTDKNGNSALHLAAMLSNEQNWNMAGPALHMQWEIKWYQFVENSMPPKFFLKYNNEGETAWDVFCSTHKDLVYTAGKWLNETSSACSVVAILIATVAFTTSATVPGGINSVTGEPILESKTAFHIFAISSLIALCFSVSSVVMFMVFFTSRYREKDFTMNLPTKYLVEVTSLLIAVAALLVSFCAGHTLVIKDNLNLKHTSFPLYAATLLPVAFYAFWQIPLYFQIAMDTFKTMPQKIYCNN